MQIYASVIGKQGRKLRIYDAKNVDNFCNIVYLFYSHCLFQSIIVKNNIYRAKKSSANVMHNVESPF